MALLRPGEQSVASPAPARLVFLDLARFLSIGLMTFAHLADSLLLPSEWQSSLGAAYLLTRGTTAPLFLLVAGWAFALSVRTRLDAYRRLGAPLLTRALRVLTLAMWGWVLTIPWWHPGFPFQAPEEAWLAFSAFGPLHCVGLSLVLAFGVVWVTRTPRQLEVAMFALGAAVVALAPAVFSAAGALHWTLQGPFRAAGYPAGFPLFPWGGFFFFGAGLGFLSARRGWSPARLAAVLLGVGALALGVAAATEGPCARWLGEATGFVSPSLVLRRLGLATGMLALAAWATRRVRVLPDAVLVPSRHALTFYVAHSLIIWGTPWFIGLHHAVGASLTFAGCAAVTFVVLAGEWVAVRSARAGDGVVKALIQAARARWRGRRPVHPVPPVPESAAAEAKAARSAV